MILYFWVFLALFYKNTLCPVLTTYLKTGFRGGPWLMSVAGLLTPWDPLKTP